MESTIKSGGSPAQWCVGDFDTDGRLDLFLSGSATCELWENAGDARFRPVIDYAGSLQYKTEPGAAKCLATDLNHDGRPDVALLYAKGYFQYHFNRGYRCMAEQGQLRLAMDDPPQEKQDGPGPLRGTTGDFDGDGALDLAVAFSSGEIRCFFSKERDAPGVWVRLPRGRTGPVTVSVWQGDAYPVCVGTYLIEGHSPPTYVSLRRAAPCSLKWRWPGGPLRTLRAEAGESITLPHGPAP